MVERRVQQRNYFPIAGHVDGTAINPDWTGSSSAAADGSHSWTSEIDWIEAEGVYIYLHVGPKKYLYRATLGQFRQKLDPARFVRTNRSVTVNVDRIRELQPQTHGNYVVILKDGVGLTLTKGYRPDLERWLKQSP